MVFAGTMLAWFALRATTNSGRACRIYCLATKIRRYRRFVEREVFSCLLLYFVAHFFVRFRVPRVAQFICPSKARGEDEVWRFYGIIPLPRKGACNEAV